LELKAPEVPNACTACPYQSPCHAAFGSSSQEYGLYPYNKAAILRAVRACADRDGERTVFNPRRVLARAVRDVLNDNVQTIRSSTFPPPGFLGQQSTAVGLPSLPTHLQARIETDYPGEPGARLESLLTFWGNLGTTPIDDGILRAFTLEPIPANLLDDTTHDEDHSPAHETAEKTSADDPPKSVQRDLDAIDAWVNGATLPQALAADLRVIVREALLARIDWFDPVIKDPDSATLSKAIPDKTRISQTVSIAGANENRASVATPILGLKRDARTAMMFRGLVFIKAGLSARAGDTLPRLDAVVVDGVGEAKRRILTELAVDDESLIHAAASLIRGAAACGHLPQKPKDLDYVNAALWRDVTGKRADAGARTQEWLTAYQGYVTERGGAVDHFLRGIGAAHGVTGGVHAIDIQRLTPLIRKAKDLAASADELTVPEWCDKAQKRLKELTRVAERQLTHWQGLIDRVREHLPEGVTWVETVDAIIETVKVSQGHGYVKVPDLRALNAHNEAARSWDSGVIKVVERLLDAAKTQTGIGLLSTVGTVAGDDLPAIADYLESSAQWIAAGISDASSSNVTVADIDDQMKQTIKTWLETVEEPVSHG